MVNSIWLSDVKVNELDCEYGNGKIIMKERETIILCNFDASDNINWRVSKGWL